MKYCSKCGKEINEDAVFCEYCGYKLNEVKEDDENEIDPNDAPSTGLAILCFLYPIIGLILYLIWNESSPLKAKSCGKGALIGVIVSAVVSVLSTIIYFIAIMALSSYGY